jgi:hypothetical protein
MRIEKSGLLVLSNAQFSRVFLSRVFRGRPTCWSAKCQRGGDNPRPVRDTVPCPRAEAVRY